MNEQAPTRILTKDIPTFVRLRSLTIDQLLKEPVSSLPLAVRAVTYCRNNNIETIGQLALCKKKDLLKAKNLGRKSVAHIIAYLNELGLGLDGRLSATVPAALPPPFLRGAKAMKLAIMTQLAMIGVPYETVEIISNLPLPTQDET